jgi:hypothetical protein
MIQAPGGRETNSALACHQERAMPITPFLNRERFDPESARVLSVALEMVCIALRTGDCDDGVKQAIATKLIAIAKAGERNPDILCVSIEGYSSAPTVGRIRCCAVFGPGRFKVRQKARELGIRNTGSAETLPRRPPDWSPRQARGPGTPPRACPPAVGFSFGAELSSRRYRQPYDFAP